MSFRIEWEPDALREFAAEWDKLDASRQRKVMDALDGMDYLLATSPMLVGESRASESSRILIHAPISVAYLVDVRMQIVRIVEAHTFKKRE